LFVIIYWKGIKIFLFPADKPMYTDLICENLPGSAGNIYFSTTQKR